MSGRPQILPDTGRGTIRRMVEGARLLLLSLEGLARPMAPSTAFGGPPPRAGEDRQC